MVIVDVVLETYDAVDFTAWPIAEPPRGPELWLGHDPAAHLELEHHGRAIRLVRKGQTDSRQPALEIPLSALPKLFVSAQQQLSGFLELVKRWATATTPGLTDEIVAVLDDYLHINEPSASLGRWPRIRNHVVSS
jgi:hypothetical protein